jgi:hypothetical protein
MKSKIVIDAMFHHQKLSLEVAFEREKFRTASDWNEQQT